MRVTCSCRTRAAPGRWRAIAVAAVLAGRAAPAVAIGRPDATVTCSEAAAGTERAQGIPADLLRSIGTVESAGRPWSVNVDGLGRSFDSKQAAIAFVRQATASGARFIDVGCFQVDLFFHPDAFASLDEAFDPSANAAYAGRFLAALHGRGPDWPDAVARYHSADPVLGGDYRNRVLAALAGRVFTAAPVVSARAAFGMTVFGPGEAAAAGPGLPRVFGP